ncbi:hypothetical protein [Thiomicrorhabdus indica]|nr:hypothetical protein [Thiomicrorhabdus indica]
MKIAWVPFTLFNIYVIQAEDAYCNDCHQFTEKFLINTQKTAVEFSWF